MNGVNKVILIGNLGKDPEVRFLESGKAICTLRLAVGERRKDGDGWKDHTEWMDVVVFDKTAENAGTYLAKGRQVYVEGRLQTRQYKDKEGHDRWKTEVVAFNVVFLSSKEGAPKTQSSSGSTSSPAPAQDQGGGFIDDDLPF